MADEERKIFVDEDWKSRAQREKEEARRKAESEQLARDQQQPAAGGPAKPSVAGGAQAAPGQQAPGETAQEPPEGPNFMALVSSLAAQCMFALGVLVPRDSQQVYVNLDEAAYTIELLKVLQEKTRGNLTEEEDAQLASSLGELQQVFAARVQQAQQQAMQKAGVDLNNLKGEPPK